MKNCSKTKKLKNFKNEKLFENQETFNEIIFKTTKKFFKNSKSEKMRKYKKLQQGKTLLSMTVYTSSHYFHIKLINYFFEHVFSSAVIALQGERRYRIF